MIRHGAHDVDDPRPPQIGKGLLAKGIRQAEATGRWLAQSGISFTGCHCSTHLRARETAALILKELPPLETFYTRDLRECLYPTEHRSAPADKPPHPLRERSLQHVLNAHRRYFRPARGQDKHELLVCHGNLIRCLVNLVFDLKPDAWVEMGTMNCGVTIATISPDGRNLLVAYNQTGHLPAELIS